MTIWRVKNEENWTEALAVAVRESENGDRIIVHTALQAELGLRARERTCPGKDLQFEIEAIAE